MNAAVQPSGNPRLPAFVNPRREPAAALGAMRVGLIGAGAIGGRIGRELAPLQPAALDIVDPKRTKAESVYTHGTGPFRVDRPKADLVAEAVHAVSPVTRVCAVSAGIADLDPARPARWNFAFLATDNLGAELEAGGLCLRYGIPLVHAAVDGDTLFAQVRFFSNRGAGGPCPGCLFSDREWRLLDQSVQYSCEGSDVRIDEVPTRSVGSLCGLAASLAVHVFLRHVVGLGPDRRDHILEYAGYIDQLRATRLRRNQACRCEHVQHRRVSLPRGADRLTARDLAELVDITSAAAFAATQIAVGGQVWAVRAQCTTCGRCRDVRRFLPAKESHAIGCPHCGDAGDGCRLETQPVVSGRQLAGEADIGVCALCSATPHTFTVRHPDGRVYLLYEEAEAL